MCTEELNQIATESQEVKLCQVANHNLAAVKSRSKVKVQEDKSTK